MNPNMADRVGFPACGRAASGCSMPPACCQEPSVRIPPSLCKNPRPEAEIFTYGGQGGIRPALRGRPPRGSDYRLAAMPFAHFAIKAQRRKAARLRNLRRRFIRPRRRGAAIPPALHSLPLPFESPPRIPKETPPPKGGSSALGALGAIRTHKPLATLPDSESGPL